MTHNVINFSGPLLTTFFHEFLYIEVMRTFESHRNREDRFLNYWMLKMNAQWMFKRMSITSYLGVRSHKENFIPRINYKITCSLAICSESLSQQHINKYSVVCLSLDGPKIISYQNYEIFQKNKSMERFGNELLKQNLHFLNLGFLSLDSHESQDSKETERRNFKSSQLITSVSQTLRH